jgi:hypothetical protein
METKGWLTALEEGDQAPSCGKVVLILYFDPKGTILQQWLPQKLTLNGVYYGDILETYLGNAIRKGVIRVLEEKVVSASRQYTTTYCTCGQCCGNGKNVPTPTSL